MAALTTLTEYPVITEPPLLAGAAHDTTACAFPATAETPVGAPGTVLGVTAALAPDDAEIPAELAAVTVNVYAVPLLKPVTVAEVATPDTPADAPPGDAVTVYPVTTEPPLLTGADHDTAAEAFSAEPVTAVGAPGTVRGVTAALATDAAEAPAELAAVTVNVYAVPLERPGTVTDVAPEVVALAPPGEAVTA